MDTRLQALKDWLNRDLELHFSDLRPASTDASFRRYFRIRHHGETYIVMDAPPDREDLKPFLVMAWTLRDIGVSVPQVLEVDQERGYLLLTDLGERLYLDALDTNSVEHLYGDALDALELIQARGPRDESVLPPYDSALLQREMALFTDWLLDRHLGLSLSAAERSMLSDTFASLERAALSQPRVCVHRDYHSRNLMVLEHDNPGVLDFQDAVVGPITYDLVSLLRDCYIAWPRTQVETWALDYLRRPAVAELAEDADEEQWLRWFDLMGVQRHLKASGIFARLFHRDGKDRYLADVPRTLRYIVDAASGHPETEPLAELVEARVLPAMEREPSRS